MFKEIYPDLENLFLGCSDLLSSCFLRAEKERTFLSALIKKFHGVLASIPPTGKKKLVYLLGNTSTQQFNMDFLKNLYVLIVFKRVL